MGVRHKIAGMMGRRRRLVVVGGVAAAVLAAAGLFVAASGGDGAPYDCDRGDYPFTSIPCPLYEQGDSRIELAGPAAEASARATAAQVASAAQARNGPDAKVLETRLVYAWSAESSNVQRDRQLAWAVSVEIPGGVFISGGAFLGREYQAALNLGGPNPALSEAERAKIEDAAHKDLEAYRATLKQQYHVDFFDPQTGEWLGAAEGASP